MAHPRRTTKKNSDKQALFLILGAAGLILVALALFMILRDDSDTKAANAANTGAAVQTRADFTLPGLGDDVTLANYRGQYVLVNFWATWCPPCQAEMPDLNAYHIAHQDQGFSVLAVNMGEDAATVTQFVRAFGIRFPVALDLTGRVFEQYGGDSLPTSFLIGPDGNVVKTWPPGKLTTAMLERDITPYLKG
jgi:thiol-disulfide isomerase/thioredoxin